MITITPPCSSLLLGTISYAGDELPEVAEHADGGRNEVSEAEVDDVRDEGGDVTDDVTEAEEEHVELERQRARAFIMPLRG